MFFSFNEKYVIIFVQHFLSYPVYQVSLVTIFSRPGLTKNRFSDVDSHSKNAVLTILIV